MPPSPLLSARMMKVTYFRLTTIISDQKISERMPSTLSGVIGTGMVRAAEDLLQRIQRAGADVAINDAKGRQRQRGQAALRRS
jgi:hypothetical protein